VPDSGSDQFTGLAGAMTIKIADGKHFYRFDFTLPALAESQHGGLFRAAVEQAQITIHQEPEAKCEGGSHQGCVNLPAADAVEDER
jgi:hypothetical protein